jgi:hypothetical protein
MIDGVRVDFQSTRMSVLDESAVHELFRDIEGLRAEFGGAGCLIQRDTADQSRYRNFGSCPLELMEFGQVE